MTWQAHDRRYHAVGVLEERREGFEFAYLRRASHVDGFRPFLGFPDVMRRYRSDHLFPLFTERVMDAARPDRPAWLAALALTRESGPMEVLARSGGHRPGDTIELLPEPRVSAEGVAETLFLVHGVRHQPGASEKISQLSRGTVLRLTPDVGNAVNARALLASADQQRLGWVPDPLLDFVHDLYASGTPLVTVERANGPEVGPHLQLLARIRGTVSPGYEPFRGPGWAMTA